MNFMHDLNNNWITTRESLSSRYVIRRVCLASETSILTFQRLNIKGVDQFVRIHKIVCTYVVGMHKVRMLFFAVGQYSL